MSDGEIGPNQMACNELVAPVTDVDQMRETIDALGRLPEERLDPEVREELLAAFRGWRGT